MNIYMTGSHGTGKTTTAEIIASKTGLGLPPSVSRRSPYTHGTIEHQKYVMDQVWKRCTTYDEVVHERTPFDAFAYTVAMGIEDVIEQQQMKVDTFARQIEQQGEAVFYFPVTFPLVSDGIRPDEEMQQHVDRVIQYHLNRTGIPYKVVACGTPEERADFILKELASAEL